MTHKAPFGGFPAAAIAFYEGLEADNTRAYWMANKQTYAESVRAPMEALLDALEDEFGPAHLFRPNRDVRFSADKSPYKDHQGAIAGRDTALGLYVAVSADGLVVGGGFRAADPAMTRRYRLAVDAPDSGLRLAKIVAELRAMVSSSTALRWPLHRAASPAITHGSSCCVSRSSGSSSPSARPHG